MIVEKGEIEKPQVVSLDKYPKWADSIDKGIIDIVINAKHSLSINTIKNTLLNKIVNFNERIERLCEKGYLKRWEEKKPTLQIGTEEYFKKAMNKENENKVK